MARGARRTTFTAIGAVAALSIMSSCSPTVVEESATTGVATPATVDTDTSSTSDGVTQTTSVIVDSTAVDASPAMTPPDSFNWSADLIGGGSIDLASYVGQDVLLWFWAPY